MERVLFKNAKSGIFVIGSLVLGSVALQRMVLRPHLRDQEVFGFDGNGGKMLKIITNLTDEEMARMKYVRRLYWHWKGSRKMDANRESISTQELADRGIAWPQETYIEYEKRPPHDKYL